MKINDSKKFFSLILLFISFKITYQIQIPIKSVKTSFNKIIKKNKNITSNNGKNKYYYMISKNMKDLVDYLFAIEVKIGSSQQTFTLLIDTGSEIAWVPGISTTGYNNYYIPGRSTSSRRTSDSFNYAYSAGTVSGYYYYDQINFLLRNNFYFTFGVATQMNIDRANFDGILGLGRKYLSYTKKYSIFDTIKTNGAITSTKFSFKYDYNTRELMLYLGEQHDDFKSSNVASCPLIESDIYETRLWVCEMFSFGVKKGDETVKRISIDYEGLFDTGTNNMMFPIEILEEFQSTFTSFNCYIYEEGDRSTGNIKAIYCRDGNNLPKIAFGLKSYILTLGNSDFYNRMYVNNELIYRLRLLFVEDLDLCIIGQNFFYEFHTLFDDDNSVLKFYNSNAESIMHHEEKSKIKTWVLVTIIIGGVIILACITLIIIYFVCWRKRNYNLLDKELLEMSSIQKMEDTIENTADNTFNHIMSITNTSNSRFNRSRRNYRNKK